MYKRQVQFRTGWTYIIGIHPLFKDITKFLQFLAIGIFHDQVSHFSSVWFVITEFIIILFGDIPPLSMIEGAFLKYFGIPVALTWFMSQKTFDGKKPYSFLKSQITYALRPKITYAGKAVKLHKQTLNETITAVRSVNYVPDKIY